MKLLSGGLVRSNGVIQGHSDGDDLVPPQWAQAIITSSVHCRRCGYDLRSLRADSQCPECGMNIWASVLHTVDPAASRLPSIRNPKAVGNALTSLAVAMLMGALLTVSRPVAALVAGAWDVRGVSDLPQRVPTMSRWYALGLALVILWSLWRLAPPRGSEPRGAVWIDLWRIGVGMLGGLLLIAAWSELSGGTREYVERLRLALHLGAVVFVTIGSIGLRGVFSVIGVRSREYRRSKGGRQSVELIIVALVAGLVAAGLRYARHLDIVPASWEYSFGTIGTVVLWISTLMVVIGLAYLTANAMWIRRSLRQPPPSPDQVLLPPVASDTSIPDSG